MTIRSIFIRLCIAALAIAVPGCAPTVSLWHHDAQKALESARREAARELLPAEYASFIETFNRGESFLLEEDIEQADVLFKLALLKGGLMEANLLAERKRLANEQLRLQEEAERNERERLKALALEEEQRRIEAEAVERLRAEALARAEAESEARRIAERQKAVRERPLPVQHTVKRGETLPQIASQPDIYADPLLWPLIYRANRDQIRDPRQLWPGQVLRIPRNTPREDIQEARRYAQERRLF